jgi:hypothetical protein
VHRIPTGGGKTLGQRMQDSEASFGKTQSSISKLDAKAVSEFGGKGKYDKDVKFKDLTGAEQLEVRKEIDKDQYARQKFGTSYDNIKEDSNKQFVNDAVNEAYKNYNAADKSTVAKEEVASKQIKTDIGITGDSSHEMVKYSTAEKAVGEFVSALRKGSYDVRNISEAPSLVKTPLNILGLGAALFGAPILGGGILGSVAGGLRGGLKKGSSEYGNVQKDFFKDLSEVIGGAITSSIKRANIKADVNIIDKKGHGSDSKGGGGHH